jgi:hypothetical protein
MPIAKIEVGGKGHYFPSSTVSMSPAPASCNSFRNKYLPTTPLLSEICEKTDPVTPLARNI